MINMLSNHRYNLSMTSLPPQPINTKIKHLYLHFDTTETEVHEHTHTHTQRQTQSKHIQENRGGGKNKRMLLWPRGAKHERRVGGWTVGVHTYMPSSPHPTISVHIFFSLGLGEKRQNWKHSGYLASVTSFWAYQPIPQLNTHTHKDHKHITSAHTHARTHIDGFSQSLLSCHISGNI